MQPVEIFGLQADPLLIAVAIAVGFGTGVLSGLLGVGGGVIFVPAAVLLLGLTQHDAQGVSLAVIIPISIVGALSHHRLGNVDRRAVVLLGITAVIGGVVGAVIAQQLSNEALRVIFGLLLLYVGQRYLGVEAFLTRQLRRQKPAV